MKKIFRLFNTSISIIIISLIKFYQLFISPMLNSNCRFLPTCSNYAIESIKIHGPFKGTILAVKRISSCHPYGREGYDPVVKKKEITNG